MTHYYNLKSYCKPKLAVLVEPPTEPITYNDSTCRNVVCTCKSNMSPIRTVEQNRKGLSSPNNIGPPAGMGPPMSSSNGMNPSSNGINPSSNGINPSSNGMGPSPNGMNPSPNGMGPSSNGMGPSSNRMNPSPNGMSSSANDIKESFTMTWMNKEVNMPSSSPEVNGPPFWFTLHNGAAYLPATLSPISAQRVRNFIDGIPEMQPCTKCSEHARAYIEDNKDRINNMTKGDEFFRFFVDFHNYVNKSLNKPIVSYDEAYAMYRKGTNIKVMKY